MRWLAAQTALATGLGTVPVIPLGTRAEQLRPFLWGLASDSWCVAGDRWGFPARLPPSPSGRDVHVGELRGAGVTRSLLVFGAQSARGVGDRHATPGLACSSFWRSACRTSRRARAWRIPMDGAGFTRASSSGPRADQCATALGAVAAYLAVEQVSGLVPFSFAFAVGAMLSPVLVELSPQAFQARRANRGRGRWWDSPRSSAASEAMLGEAVGRCGALRVEGIRSNERGSP